MTSPLAAARGAGTATDPREATLRKAARDLEGTFTQQLFKAMRDTVPTDGTLVERSQGEDIFAGLMDERVAADTGTRWHRGLGDAIYRALREKAGLAPAVPSDLAGPAVPDVQHASSARLP